MHLALHRTATLTVFAIFLLIPQISEEIGTVGGNGEAMYFLIMTLPLATIIFGVVGD
jgi:hypothetical protein